MNAIKLSQGQRVRFTYTAVKTGETSQRAGYVQEVKPSYMKIWEPDKDQYRTFRFDGVANLQSF